MEQNTELYDIYIHDRSIEEVLLFAKVNLDEYHYKAFELYYNKYKVNYNNSCYIKLWNPDININLDRIK